MKVTKKLLDDSRYDIHEALAHICQNSFHGIPIMVNSLIGKTIYRRKVYKRRGHPYRPNKITMRPCGREPCIYATTFGPAGPSIICNQEGLKLIQNATKKNPDQEKLKVIIPPYGIRVSSGPGGLAFLPPT